MKLPAVLQVALLGFAIAVPIAEPQDIDLDAYDAIDIAPDVSAPIGVAPQILGYDVEAAIDTAVASAIDPVDPDLQKRVSCGLQDAGNYPTVTPDTSDAFSANPTIAGIAKGALPPPGYFLVNGFKNLAGSASADKYLGYTSSSLTSYKPAQCATACSAIQGCVSFNIFFERDPALFTNEDTCRDSPSVTRIKCSFWGTVISVADATNKGQYSGNFHVVIAGSNAYTVSQPPTITGFTGPDYLGNAVTQAPNGENTLMGQQTFPSTQPYDPAVCAAACKEKSAYNLRHETTPGSARICRFFDAFLLYKNEANSIFTCLYYTKSYDASYATNVGQYNGAGDHYTPEHSYTYTLKE